MSTGNNVWAREIEKASESYREEARRRRVLSKVDPVADALEHVASDLEKRKAVLSDPAAERTPAEYAAEHGVTEQTVRNWIHAEQLEARDTPNGYRIPAGAVRARKRAKAS